MVIFAAVFESLMTFPSRGLSAGVFGLTVASGFLVQLCRTDLFARLMKLRKGQPAVGRVDLCEGPLSLFAHEFALQLEKTRKKPKFYNFVDLCGATRTSMHEANSEWWLNRSPDINAFVELKRLTLEAQALLSLTITSKQWSDAQKHQLRGMESNVAIRVRVYEAMLDASLPLRDKAQKIQDLAKEMEPSQEELLSLCEI
jgi:hypothetical protein